MAEVMSIEKLSAAIEKENQAVERYTKKKEEYEEKIEQSKARIAEYEMMLNSQRYSALSKAAAAGGVSMEDLLLAFANGDFLSLQERYEAQKNHE